MTSATEAATTQTAALNTLRSPIQSFIQTVNFSNLNIIGRLVCLQQQVHLVPLNGTNPLNLLLWTGSRINVVFLGGNYMKSNAEKK